MTGLVDTYVRRPDPMRRADAGVQRNPERSRTIAADHLERAARYEKRGCVPMA